MKILILGGSGMLGHKLVQQLKRNFEVFTTLRSNTTEIIREYIIGESRIFNNVDAANFSSVENAVNQVKPDVIINCIGIIKQLPPAKDIVTILNVNSIFPHLLQELSRRANSRLITISTDCVFNGDKGNYKETDIPNAEDLYGKSKNLGEVAAENCLTIRTSIIGREIKTANSLVEWFLSNRGGSVKGFSRAIYSGFPTVILADIIENLIKNHPEISGLYHVSSEPINKYELLCLIKEAYNLDIDIEIDKEFKIDRSLNSEKFRKEANYNPPGWQQMIERMRVDKTPYQEMRKL
jgi:dTDP-4-dehydrorhamnose reductase